METDAAALCGRLAVPLMAFYCLNVLRGGGVGIITVSVSFHTVSPRLAEQRSHGAGGLWGFAHADQSCVSASGPVSGL